MTVTYHPVLKVAPAVETPARLVAGTPARLVLPGVESTDWGLAQERELGYFGIPVEAEELLAELEKSGLRGRGGAGFPVHRKWQTLAEAEGPTVVVANGHEGEPASSKDVWLMTRRPFLVLDGLILAAQVAGAEEAYVYLSDAEAARTMESAIAELEREGLVTQGLKIRVHLGENRYVGGEESAVCQALNGFPAKPTDKPPRPFESGVHGKPTLINNVESLAHVAWIRLNGGTAFASVGSETSKGTALFTLTGEVAEPGVYEMSLGRPLGDLIQASGGNLEQSPGILVGGWFSGILAGDQSALSCCYESIRKAGSGLGCAAVSVLGPEDDLLATGEALASWFAVESAGQCGICVSGTNAIARSFRQLLRGENTQNHVDRLREWGAISGGRAACAFVDGAFTLARTVSLELEISGRAVPRTSPRTRLSAGKEQK